MKGELQKEFIERVEAALDKIHNVCDEIKNGLLDVYYKLKQIKGLTEIDDIRNTLGELIEDLQ